MNYGAVEYLQSYFAVTPTWRCHRVVGTCTNPRQVKILMYIRSRVQMTVTSMQSHCVVYDCVQIVIQSEDKCEYNTAIVRTF